MSLLKIDNLHVAADNKEIIRGLDLDLEPGQMHVIMGPNGSGKSTLAQTIIGHPNFNVTKGDIKIADKSILNLKTDERVRAGIFLIWQHPRTIEGVRVLVFLKAVYDASQKAKNKDYQPMLVVEFRDFVLDLAGKLQINEDLLNRYLNQDFSGGEKKKLEVLQLLLLNPTVAIIDEVDSGLDVDALQVVARGIKLFQNQDKAVLLITHYNRLLKLLEPDYVHIMKDGKLIISGDKNLAAELEERGYDAFN